MSERLQVRVSIAWPLIEKKGIGRSQAKVRKPIKVWTNANAPELCTTRIWQLFTNSLG